MLQGAAADAKEELARHTHSLAAHQPNIEVAARVSRRRVPAPAATQLRGAQFSIRGHRAHQPPTAHVAVGPPWPQARPEHRRRRRYRAQGQGWSIAAGPTHPG